MPSATAHVHADEDGDADGHGQAGVDHRGGDVQRWDPLRDLADMASALVDGSITLSKTLRDPALMLKQVELYRAFVRAVFAPG